MEKDMEKLKINEYVQKQIIEHIYKTTSCPAFKEKVVFFRSNRKKTKRQNIHTFFMNNDTYYYCYCMFSNFENLDDVFFEYYSNNFEAFDITFSKWIQHVNKTYENENSYCLIL